MLQQDELIDTVEFEEDDFAEKCLEEFDKAIAEIEEVYATASKSA